MNLIQAFVEVLLLASGLFFLSAALLDGRRLPRWAGVHEAAQPRDAVRGPMLLPRRIQRTALD